MSDAIKWSCRIFMFVCIGPFAAALALMFAAFYICVKLGEAEVAFLDWAYDKSELRPKVQKIFDRYVK